MNARLQVEHGVTEEVWGVDLVEWMVKLAAGELPPLGELSAHLKPVGHSVQARIYAEDPNKDFQPGSGLVTRFVAPVGDVRCDTWVESGTEVSQYYDPMLAKLIVHRQTRDEAILALARALGISNAMASRPIRHISARFWHHRSFPGRRSRLASLVAFPTNRKPLMSSTQVWKPRCRTTPAGSVCGTSACLPRGPLIH
ncbi:MAG: hypothetical protein R3F31_01370 [Verrucomicrobiales bacterium]